MIYFKGCHTQKPEKYKATARKLLGKWSIELSSGICSVSEEFKRWEVTAGFPLPASDSIVLFLYTAIRVFRIFTSRGAPDCWLDFWMDLYSFDYRPNEDIYERSL